MTYGRCNLLKEWSEWDPSVHESEAQISRQGRSKTYPFTFDIDEASKTARFSSTSELPYYDTSLSGCTCFDFQNRHLPCKHMYRLASELGVVEIISRHGGGGGGNYDKDALAAIRASSDINSHPDQIKRIQSAKSKKTAPISIDRETQTGVFAGSGKEPYTTTLTSCTCRDYFVRRLPCKHMYRLSMELGVFDTDIPAPAELSFQDAVAELEKMPEVAQRQLQTFLRWAWPSTSGEWAIDVTPELEPLKSCPLVRCELVPASDAVSFWLSSFRKCDLIDFLTELQIEPPKMKKADLAEWCAENIPNIEQMAPKRMVVSFAPEFSKTLRNVYIYLRRKFDWEYFGVDEFRYPAGSEQESLVLNISISENGTEANWSGDTSLYWFPDDEITHLLTKYGCNRCLGGYKIER